jgi:hypothetical protein
MTRSLVAALALLALAGCAGGDIRIDYTRDLSPEARRFMSANPWHHVYIEGTSVLPMFYLEFGDLRKEEGSPTWHAEWRGIYGSGILAQRYHDASFDLRGRNLSHRIVELWLFGLAWKWDRVVWYDAGGRKRDYLDATVLFGAFGYSSAGDDRSLVLLWLPLPLP